MERGTIIKRVARHEDTMKTHVITLSERKKYFAEDPKGLILNLN